MRVIAGQYRSRPLRALPGAETRPTSDRLRETLFNVLAAATEIDGSTWIDLFAGTGAVGIEALSRGAAHVYFVESTKKAAALIRENLRALGINNGFDIYERDAAQALRQLEGRAVADIIFLDPPYAMASAYEQALRVLGESGVVGEGTVVIAEHEKRFDPGANHGFLRRYRTLTQGDAALSFYRRDASV